MTKSFRLILRLVVAIVLLLDSKSSTGKRFVVVASFVPPLPKRVNHRSLLLRSLFPTTTPKPFRRISPKASISSSNSVAGGQETAKPVSAQVVAKKTNDEQFDWFKSWYPLVPVDMLDPEKPHAFELLGESIVVWNDAPIEGSGAVFRSKKKRLRQQKRNVDVGQWRVFVDACPHRKVPLSQGRVEDDGTLLCSYHAWRYNGTGACVAVPSIKTATSNDCNNNNNNALARILASPLSSCTSFPTQVVNGLLFVWPSADENAALESALTPVVVHRPAEDLQQRDASVGPWAYFQLPYGADFFLENIVDPAHVFVAHHNVVGDRYNSQVIEIETKEPLSKSGFAIAGTREIPGGARSTFHAPSLVTITSTSNGATQTLELYASPSRPGTCNEMGRAIVYKNDQGQLPSTLRYLTYPVPIWLRHVLGSVFLNQDAQFLQNQERNMALTGLYTTALPAGQAAYDYTKAIYPVNSDTGVLHLRNWIRKYAGGRIPYKYNQTAMPPPSTTNVNVFDQWNGHTKYCRFCQAALQRCKRIRVASFAAAACTAILRPFGLGGGGVTKSSSIRSSIITLVVTLLFFAAGMVAHKLIGLFYQTEFSHAEND